MGKINNISGNFFNNFVQNFRVFLQLIRRDIKVLKSNIISVLIDNLCMLCVVILTFGYLLPKMGMEKNLIGPIFIGQTLSHLFEIGFSLATKIVQDIKFNKFIEYQLGLPISVGWLITAYIVNFIIEASVITLPMLTLGILILGKKFIIYKTSWLGFIVIYTLVTIFFAALFMLYSFAYEYTWFWNNIWPRRIEPLYDFGCIYFLWKKLYAFSPVLGTLFLLNPVTYATEGTRAALIGGNQFIHILFCIIGLTIAILLILYLLKDRVRKRLDHI